MVEGVHSRDISGHFSFQHAVVIENVVDDPGVDGHQPLQIGGVIGHDGIGLCLYHGVYRGGRTIQRLGGGGTVAVLGKDLPVQLAEIHLPVIIDAQMLVEVFLDLLHAVLCRKAIIFGGIADDANNGQCYTSEAQFLSHPIGNARIPIHVDSVHVQIIILHPAFHRQTACSAVGTGGAVKHGHKRLVCIVGRRHGAGIAFDPMGIVDKSRIRPYGGHGCETKKNRQEKSQRFLHISSILSAFWRYGNIRQSATGMEKPRKFCSRLFPLLRSACTEETITELAL